LSKVCADKDISGAVEASVVFGEGSVCLSKFLVTVEVSVVVERMREEDKRERLERQYLLFTQPLVYYLTSALFLVSDLESDTLFSSRSLIIYEIK
jgi:hypothetical protein